MKKANRYYTDEFKKQIVELRKSGKTRGEINREYGVSKTAIDIWVKQIANTGKFGVIENETETEKEIKVLRKENKHLRMENDILKQAALIMGRKDV